MNDLGGIKILTAFVFVFVPQGQRSWAAETGPAGSQRVGAQGKAQAARDYQQGCLYGNRTHSHTHWKHTGINPY